MPWDNSSLNAGAVMAGASLKQAQTIRVGGKYWTLFDRPLA
jgi:hypothetical protein